MKHLICIFSILLSLSSLRAQQPNESDTTRHVQLGQQRWVQIPTSAVSTFSYVAATGSDTLWASSDGDGIFRSTDRGLSWHVVPCPATHGALLFESSHQGFLGSGTQIYRTSDGGGSWDSAFSGENDIHTLTSINNTLFGTYLADVLRSIDGGKTWVIEPLDGFVNAVSFSDSKHGVLVGDQGQYHIDSPRVAAVFTTTNGGESWQFRYSGLKYDLSSVKALSASLFIAVSAEGYIATSTDGGRSWRDTLAAPLHNGFTNVNFNASGEGIAVGGLGKILFTSDIGKHWQEEVSGTSNDLYSSAFIDDSTIVVAGGGGTILRTSQRGLNGVFQIPSLQSLPVATFPNPSNGSIRFAFSLPKPQNVTLSVFSLNGQLVTTLLPNVPLLSGSQTALFDGSALASGTYEFRLSSDSFQAAGQFQLVK